MNTKSVHLDFNYLNEHYEGEAVPSASKQNTFSFPAFDIFFNNEYTGTIVKTKDQWASDNRFDNGLIAAIGSILITVLMTM